MRIIICLTIFLLFGCAKALPLKPQRNASRAEHFIQTGVISLRAGDAARAEAAFFLAEQLGGGAAALDGRGCAEYMRGNLLSAERLFKSALSIQPGYSRALSHLGLVAESQGHFAEARNFYEAAIRIDPEDYRARNDLAAMLAETSGRTETARAKDELMQAHIISGDKEIAKNLTRINE